MKLSFYFDIYPWTKTNDVIYASTLPSEKCSGATRYRVDVEIKDPAQPDEVITALPNEVTFHHPV